ncbi:MAG: hypothetical protein RLZZ444_3217 [Pseudomonadota bacterium]|jgi:DNA-binding transcriptional LysR family regulator
MDRIDALRTFIKVMEAGSFTQVADQLGIGQPAVSKRIALLEAEFRTKLFQRSTRSLKPTHEADRILKAARDILATYDDVMAPETPREARPTGLLRIAVPTSFGRHYFHRIFLEYRRRYPEVKIAVQSSERLTDLVSEGVELAIRIGDPGSNALIARRIRLIQRRLVAAPSLFADRPLPLLPDHLGAIPCIAYARLSPHNQWAFESDSGRHVVSITPEITCDEADFMTEAALAGLGVAVLPEWCARPGLKDGRLIEILPDYSVPSLPLHVIFPDSRWTSLRARLFRDLLVELSEAGQLD